MKKILIMGVATHYDWISSKLKFITNKFLLPIPAT